MKKVYCKNCKYLKEMPMTMDLCKASEKYGDNPNGNYNRHSTEVWTASDTNEDNDCEYYCPWWKFWG